MSTTKPTKLTPTTLTLEERAAMRELLEADREAANPVAALGIGLDLRIARMIAGMVFRRRSGGRAVLLTRDELAAIAVVAIRRWVAARGDER